MAGSTSRANERSARTWALAHRQHGVVSRRDLLTLGFTPSAIEHRIAKGRLHPIHRGVYAVGRQDLTREGRWMAAVLACGEGAALSHRSAGALWGIADEGERIEVSVRRASVKRHRSGIHVRGRPSLPSADVVTWRGVPLTGPTRTVLDLATLLGPAALERTVNDADKRGLIDAGALLVSLEGHTGQPGVKALRSLLNRHTFRLSDSELERLFRPIAAAAGLPPPATQVEVNGFKVDFFWPDLGLVVETDGLRYHRTPSAQARDRVRDQAHTAAGLATLRFTHRQVRHEAAHVLRVLRATAASFANAR